MKPWDERFPEIETIALMELNRLVPKAKAAGVDVAKLGLDPRVVKLLGAVTLQVDIFTNYGRDNERHKSITRRLREKTETIQVGEIEF
jgi:hypothetical protein